MTATVRLAQLSPRDDFIASRTDRLLCPEIHAGNCIVAVNHKGNSDSGQHPLEQSLHSCFVQKAS